MSIIENFSKYIYEIIDKYITCPILGLVGLYCLIMQTRYYLLPCFWVNGTELENTRIFIVELAFPLLMLLVAAIALRFIMNSKCAVAVDNLNDKLIKLEKEKNKISENACIFVQKCDHYELLLKYHSESNSSNIDIDKVALAIEECSKCKKYSTNRNNQDVCSSLENEINRINDILKEQKVIVILDTLLEENELIELAHNIVSKYEFLPKKENFIKNASKYYRDETIKSKKKFILLLYNFNAKDKLLSSFFNNIKAYNKKTPLWKDTNINVKICIFHDTKDEGNLYKVLKDHKIVTSKSEHIFKGNNVINMIIFDKKEAMQKIEECITGIIKGLE